MSKRTCFVIMPIGDQEYNGKSISALDLKARYTDLIREAILKAEPDLEVTRADEVAIPGTITSDILTRIMHSDIVVADVTYPNPNVYYELGLRHASKSGTIILRDSSGPHSPFDIAHLRHIVYKNSPTGLKQLASEISNYLSHFESNPDATDNQFLEMAKLTSFKYPNYDSGEEISPEEKIITSLFQQPEVFEMAIRKSQGEDVDDSQMARAMMSNPDVTALMVKHLVKSRGISFGNTVPTQPKKHKKKTRKKRNK